MFNFFVDTESSKLQRVMVTASPYDMGYIRLVFKEGVDEKQVEDICAEIKTSKSPFGGFWICFDVANVPMVIKTLTSKSFISDNDRPKFGTLLQEVDKILKQRSMLDYSAEKSQKELLFSVADVYIDDIINNCKNLETAIKLLRSALYGSYLFIAKDIESFIARENIDMSVVDSIHTLWKICHGQANMETTYLRMGKAIPVLKLQKIIICERIIEKMRDKIAELDDEDQLYILLGLLLFKVEGQTILPLSDTKKIIIDYLKRDEPSTYADQMMEQAVWGPGVLQLTTQAFGIMGILSQKMPDIARIKQLQKKFNSPLLARYLVQLNQAEIKRQEDSRNHLLQSLAERDESKVKIALDKKADVNQYFNCGRTPLILAVQECGSNIVELVLRYKPDVNKFNLYQIFNPLFSAIRKQKPRAAELLLAAGADVFAPCGTLFVKAAVFPYTSQSQIASPMAVGLDTFKTEKTKESKDIFNTLLRYGAGIGFRFTDAYPELHGAVIVGGFCPVDTNVSPILTADQFKARVAVKDYLHWQKIFQQILVSATFQLNTPLLKEVNTILSHIKNTPSVSGASVSETSEVKKANTDAKVLIAHKDSFQEKFKTLRMAVIENIKLAINADNPKFAELSIGSLERAFLEELNNELKKESPDPAQLGGIVSCYKEKLSSEGEIVRVKLKDLLNGFRAQHQQLLNARTGQATAAAPSQGKEAGAGLQVTLAH